MELPLPVGVDPPVRADGFVLPGKEAEPLFVTGMPVGVGVSPENDGEETGNGVGGEITPGRLLIGVGVGRGGVGVASSETSVSSAQMPVSISSDGVRYWLGTESRVASSADDGWLDPYEGDEPFALTPDSTTATAELYTGSDLQTGQGPKGSGSSVVQTMQVRMAEKVVQPATKGYANGTAADTEGGSVRRRNAERAAKGRPSIYTRCYFRVTRTPQALGTRSVLPLMFTFAAAAEPVRR